MLADSEFSPWDIFWVSDLVIIPSRWEGFGNNLLEAIAYKKPVVVYSYPVLESDILPKGFDFITVSENESNLPQVEETIGAILDYLARNGDYPDWVREAIEYNYNLANQVFSYAQIGNMLRAIISSLP
jgi:glycosyltransferase involved in cell wall biosynthesis